MRGKVLLVTVLVLAMASGAFAATRTTAYTAAKAMTPPVMDGVMTPGEWEGTPFGGGLIGQEWMDANGQYGRIIWRVDGWVGVTDDADFSCYVYIMWDETNIYYCIDATSSGPNFLGGPFAGETVQMIVDPTGTGGTNQWSINVANNGEFGANNSYGSCTPPTSGIDVGYAETSDGYVMEFAIPITGGAPDIAAVEGTTFGLLLAFIIIDSDGAGPHDPDHWDDIWLLGGPYPTTAPDPVPNPFEQPGPLSAITLGPAIEVADENVITSNPPGPFYEAGMYLELHGPSGFTNYQWTKDSAPVVDGGHISGATTDTLVFDPLDESDSGAYVCTYDDGTKAAVSTPPFSLSVYAAGSVPAVGLAGLVLLCASLCVGGRIAYKRTK